MRKFYIKTFGCTANTSASELMSYLLINCGYEKVNTINEADFALINTCIVKSPTESKIKALLKALYQKIPLIITGCLPQVMFEWCRFHLPKAVLLGVDHFDKICNAAKNLLEGRNFEMLTRSKSYCHEINRLRDNKYTSIVEISKGCTGQCAYCIVKIAKGNLVSKSEDQILEEVKNALKEDCKEIWITAQDTASYGVDINSSLPKIINQILQIPKEYMIRIGMMNANNALNILNDLKSFLQNPKIYSFLHIPLQSGSDEILQKMNRKYSIEEYLFLINELRKIKNFTLSTDIIAGFPGEKESDFEKTIDLMKKIKFDIVNISKYGDRKGTEASKSLEKLPTEIIKERSRKLTKLVNQMTYERNKLWLGWKGRALALKRDDENQSTLLRNSSYKLIAINEPNLELGKWYEIEVKNAFATRLIGIIL